MPEKNEQNPKESTPEEELEPTRARVAELEGFLAQRDKELASAESRISELEQVAGDKDNQIAVLKQSVADLEQKLADLNNTLSQAISSYRALAVKSNQGVPRS